MQGQKHLVKCRCILPQFLKMPDPPLHQFVVFSVINDDGSVNEKFVQCPNCGIVHRVYDILKSEIKNGKENLPSMTTKDELKLTIPERVVSILETNDCDIATWEYVSFVFENSKWDESITLRSEIIDGVVSGKYLRVLGRNLYKVEQFVREEYVHCD